jgi:hypothetical protein
MSEIWDNYNGHKAAFGEDPTTIDPRGHQWVHDSLYLGFCGWGPETSLQMCSACNETRGVMIHPGYPRRRSMPGGFVGCHGFKYECNTDCPSKETDQ